MSVLFKLMNEFIAILKKISCFGGNWQAEYKIYKTAKGIILLKNKEGLNALIQVKTLP